ncbi:MAG: ankyrin repeat domain-containing protein [Abditibacteriota bacterium]|nr:ankyrin repeat domain-containing protein [Abditibacteriota bacterium]
MKYLYIFSILIISLPGYSNSIDDFCSLCEKGDTKKMEENISSIDINEQNSNGIPPLIYAVNSNKIQAVNLLINHGANLNIKDSSGSTPLLNAIANYNYEITELWVNEGADVNISDRYNVSPLFHCVQNSSDIIYFNDYLFKDDKESKKFKPTKAEEEDYNNKLKIIGLLIDKGADINAETDEGISPVMQSILDNNLLVFDLFVKKGFDINSFIGKNQTTPLNLCIINKNTLFIDYLLNQGADINKPDKDGFLPIYSAIISDNLRLVKDLIGKGVDVNAIINNDKDTPIGEACKLNRENIVNYLIEVGADLNAKDNYGFTAVHDAVLYPKILKKLIEKGADINQKDFEGETPLHLAVKYNKPESAEILVDAGAVLSLNIDNQTPTDLIKENKDKFTEILSKAQREDIISKEFECISKGNLEEVKNNLDTISKILDEDNNNALYYAIVYNQKDIFDLLIDISDVNNQNHAGITPLYEAARVGNVYFAEKLLEKGALIELDNIQKESPFMIGAVAGNLDMVKFLSDKGAEINTKDINGANTISLAFLYSNKDTIDYLLTLPVDLNSQDNDGNTPCHYLMRRQVIEDIEPILSKYIELGGDINKTNLSKQTPLHLACAQNLPISILKLLVNYNNINKKDSMYTPLGYAIIRGNYDNVKYLMDAGATLDKLGLFLFYALNKNYNEKLFKFISENVKDTNIIRPQGTLLNIAINNDNVSAVKILLEKGADVNLKGTSYPLISALIKGNKEILNLILEKNPNPNIEYVGGLTPLMFASKYDDYATVKKLIDLGADATKSSNQGFNALHLAIFNQTEDKEKIINLLLEKGIDINAKSSLGLTPIHVAMGMGDFETTKILKDKGATIEPTKMQVDALEVARDRGYEEILTLFGKTLPPLKEGEKFDSCDYKLKIVKVTKELYEEIKPLLEEYLVCGNYKTQYDNGTVMIELKSPYVIGELTQIFTKIENRQLKLKRITDPDKSIDLTCEIIFK